MQFHITTNIYEYIVTRILSTVCREKNRRKNIVRRKCPTLSEEIDPASCFLFTNKILYAPS